MPTPTLRGPSVLLEGPPGSGKSHSLVTIMEAGYDLFLIVTEPNGLETVVNAMQAKKIPASRLKYRVIEPAREGFASLTTMAKNVTLMGYDGLSKMSPTERSKAQFLEVLATLSNFVDERTGEAFGAVDQFPPQRAVTVDSLSGLNLMAMDLTIGDKVTAHQGEWGIAMNMLDKLILAMTSNLKCLFVLTAHIEPETDELTMGRKLMVSTLGRKLAPKVPRFFSEVVLTSVEGDKYYWNTSFPGVDLKHRALRLGQRLAPSFAPIIAAYNERLTYLKANA